MKKLLIYDASCPMCRVYTKGMVAADHGGCLIRISNEQLTDKRILNQIDQQRARHEIPMIDLDGGKTLYGVDTWLYALGQYSQPLKKLLSFGWILLILQKLYAFISYNRRIIITSAPGRWQLLDLQPDFRLSYRLPFSLLVLAISGVLFFILNQASEPVSLLIASQLLITGLYIRVVKPDHFSRNYTGLQRPLRHEFANWGSVYRNGSANKLVSSHPNRLRAINWATLYPGLSAWVESLD